LSDDLKLLDFGLDSHSYVLPLAACPAKKMYYNQKGQAIKRVASLLGNGFTVSTGEFWIRQRRMIQQLR
jgi:hypothetical protein